MFLHMMQKDGWDAIGLEYSREVAEIASRKYNVRVLCGDLSECNLKAGTFDVINVSHVLEHVIDPPKLIAECHRLLKKDGLLITAVPNLASLQASFGSSSWFHLDVPNHLYHFTEQGLIALLESRSFNVMKVRRLDWEYNLFGWLQTLLNRSGFKHNFLYDFLKHSELQQTKLTMAGMRDIMLTGFLLPVFVPVALVLTILEALMKRSGTVEVLSIRD